MLKEVLRQAKEYSELINLSFMNYIQQQLEYFKNWMVNPAEFTDNPYSPFGVTLDHFFFELAHTCVAEQCI